jgi:hypothetical protein
MNLAIIFFIFESNLSRLAQITGCVMSILQFHLVILLFDSILFYACAFLNFYSLSISLYLRSFTSTLTKLCHVISYTLPIIRTIIHPKVKHGGNTFEWKDICASNNIGLGTVYEFPCVRLTPMDLFQEASWYMTETDRVSWYKAGIQENVVVPRIGRFGIMTTSCAPACGELLNARISSGKTLNLFGDLTAMEMNYPCRICIETTYEATMDQITNVATGLFDVMAQQLQRSYAVAETANDGAKMVEIGTLLQKVGVIYAKVDRAAMEEFFMYNTTRGIYGQLGARPYLEKYDAVNAGCGSCMTPLANRVGVLMTNNAGMTGDEALALIAGGDLKAHADAPFNSVNTAGNPFPLSLPSYAGPVGGSGVSFAGQLLSSSAYFDLENAKNATLWNPLFGATGGDGAAGIVDPSDSFWISTVETDPVYKWFMAGETKLTARKYYGTSAYRVQCLIYVVSFI